MLTKILLLSLLTLTACSSLQGDRKPSQETEVKVLLRDSQGRVVEAPNSLPNKLDGKSVTAVSNENIAQSAEEQQQIQIAMSKQTQNMSEDQNPPPPTLTDATEETEEGVAVSTPATPPAPVTNAEIQEIKKSVSNSAAQIRRMHSLRLKGNVPPETAQRYLRNGNNRFAKGTFRNDGVSPQDRRRVAAQQKPHAAVLACGDSSAPPEVIFDQKLGEIFVVRTHGQALDTMAIESLEYAISALGTNLLVVLGHDECDSVKNALAAMKGLEITFAQKSIFESLKPRLAGHTHATPSIGHAIEAWSNVEGAAHEITERSALIRDAVTSGEVKVVRALYRQSSGQVEWRN